MSTVQPQFKRLISAAGYANTSAGATPSEAPTWTVGAGVPADDEPDGSIYSRTDATNGDDLLYGRISGAWVAILGQTA